MAPPSTAFSGEGPEPRVHARRGRTSVQAADTHANPRRSAAFERSMPEHAEQRWTPRLLRSARTFGRHLARHASGGEERPRPAAGEFAVRSVRDGARQILKACGQLELASAWRLEQELRRAEATDAREILVDLRGLEFIDSAGMEVVIHAGARTRLHGKELMILSPPDHVHRCFELSGLVARLPFVDRRVGVPLP